MLPTAKPSRVFISYTHDAPEHASRVLELSDRLRSEGIDAMIDRYEETPPEGWPRWMINQISTADFVLMVCTETYKRRFEGNEEQGKGLGGNWEGAVLTQNLYEDQGKNTRFIPVVFHVEDTSSIPLVLRSTTHYRLDIEDGYERLYRRLTGQPSVAKPELGERRVLPPLQKQRSRPVKLWNVPYPRNPFFTGRESILAEIREGFASGGGPQTVCGIAGVGKTQIASEYAHHYRDDYEAVLWVQADSYEDFITSCVAIAHLLDLPAKDVTDQNAMIGAVKNWLATNGRWLLICDNTNDLETIIQQLLPQRFTGHVLFTTQIRITGSLAKSIEVRQLEPDEGALLLLRRAKFIEEGDSLEEVQPEHRLAAKGISEELGGLPLALDQAGAFIEEVPSTPEEYLHLYQKEGARLREERGYVSARHPESVTVAFALSFAKVEAANQASADLLRLCALLSPEPIPEEILVLGAAELGESLGSAAVEPMGLVRAISETSRYSLLLRDPIAKTLTVHRLVQHVLRDEMNSVERQRWSQRVVQAVSKAFAEVEFSDWQIDERLLPHAQACASLVREWSFEDADAARLLERAGIHLTKRARFDEAEPLLRLSLDIREKILGPEHLYVAGTLNSLGSLYAEQLKYREAEPLLERSLRIREQNLHPDHPNLARALDGLALLYLYMGRYTDAEPLFKRALEICEKVEDKKYDIEERADVATTYNNMALLYESQGRYEEAEPLYKRALEIHEKTVGAEHPFVATVLNNLANLYRMQGNYAESEQLQKRALEIREKIQGPEHPDVGASLLALAAIHGNQGDYQEAERLIRSSLELWEKTLGPENARVAKGLGSLATLKRELGRYTEAEPLYLRALEVAETSLGPTHPNVADILGYLAVLYGIQGRYDEALSLFKRCLKMKEDVLGTAHPKVAAVLSSLGELYRHQGQLDEAEKLQSRALQIVEEALGPDHPAVGSTLNNLAQVHRARGALDEALALFERSLNIREKALKNTDPDVAQSINNVADIYQAKGESGRALPLFERALRMWEAALGPEHPEVGRALNNLAATYQDQGEFDKAEPLYKRALEILENALGPEHPEVANVLTSYATLLALTSRSLYAKELFSRAQSIMMRTSGQ